MGSSVNRAEVIGRLGGDPEVRYTQGGDAVANISIATDESYKNKDGEKVEKTEWHKVVVFGKLAEICGEWLKKGKLVRFTGKLQTKKWTDKEGIERYTTEIVVDSFRGEMNMFPDGKSKEEREDEGGEEKTTRTKPAAKAAAPAKTQADLGDDDIPF